MRVSFACWELVNDYANQVKREYGIITPKIGVLYSPWQSLPGATRAYITRFEHFPVRIGSEFADMCPETEMLGYMLAYYRQCKCLYVSNIAATELPFDEFVNMVNSQCLLLEKVKKSSWYLNLLKIPYSEIESLVTIGEIADNLTKIITEHVEDRQLKFERLPSIYDLMLESLIKERKCRYPTPKPEEKYSKEKHGVIADQYYVALRKLLFAKVPSVYRNNLTAIAIKNGYDLSEVDYVIGNFKNWIPQIKLILTYLFNYEPTPLFYKFISQCITDEIICKFYLPLFEDTYHNFVLRLQMRKLDHYCGIHYDIVRKLRKREDDDPDFYICPEDHSDNIALYVIAMCKCKSSAGTPISKTTCNCIIYDNTISRLTKKNPYLKPFRILRWYYQQTPKTGWAYLKPHLNNLPAELVDDLPMILVDWYIDDEDMFCNMSFIIMKYIESLKSNQQAYILYIAYIYQCVWLFYYGIDVSSCSGKDFRRFAYRMISNKKNTHSLKNKFEFLDTDEQNILRKVMILMRAMKKSSELVTQNQHNEYWGKSDVEQFENTLDSIIKYKNVNLIDAWEIRSRIMDQWRVSVCNIIEDIHNMLYGIKNKIDWNRLHTERLYFVIKEIGDHTFGGGLKQYSIEVGDKLGVITDFLFTYLTLKAPTPAFYKMIRKCFKNARSNGIAIADLYIQNFVAIEEVCGSVVRGELREPGFLEFGGIYRYFSTHYEVSHFDTSLIQLLECECGDGIGTPPHLVDCKCYIHVHSKFEM